MHLQVAQEVQPNPGLPSDLVSPVVRQDIVGKLEFSCKKKNANTENNESLTHARSLGAFLSYGALWERQGDAER